MCRIIATGLLVLELLIGLMACSLYIDDDRYLQSRPDVYLSAVEEPELQISPGLSDENLSHIYDIREVPGQPGDVSLLPPI